MTFAELAAERGLKDTDIDLGTVTKSAMVDRAVADAAFALKQGEVSAPVEGRFGIVLVQVVKIEPATTRPFEEVAAELKQEMATERARSELTTLHDKIEDERLGGATLADLPRSSTSRRASSKRSTAPGRIATASRSPTCRRASTW